VTARKGITESKTPSIIDLNAEVAKLTMFHGRTPQSTMADRQGSAARFHDLPFRRALARPTLAISWEGQMPTLFALPEGMCPLGATFVVEGRAA
jgi:hypothetical protein